ncbi:hypothetical protein HD596_002993 [Nonomuraea jabiensis]|uniref:Uncharacterized protein n=1 Tax=Nonomuraea jabiensis TaxID=882448 RepID=A0A7W9G2X1_9ACTN|nr:hypothetical protein [Nonomuraea jabiensis]
MREPLDRHDGESAPRRPAVVPPFKRLRWVWVPSGKLPEDSGDVPFVAGDWP